MTYLIPSNGPGQVAQVDVEEPIAQETIVVAVKSQQDAMLDLMSKLVDRLERLEAQNSDQVTRQRIDVAFGRQVAEGGESARKCIATTVGRRPFPARICQTETTGKQQLLGVSGTAPRGTAIADRQWCGVRCVLTPHRCRSVIPPHR